MIWDTIKLNRKLKPDSSGANIFYPYKGTKLGDKCFEQGMVNLEKFDASSSERRESVLNYPDKYKRRLERYQKYWDFYVYPYSIKKVLMLFLRQIKFLKKMKQAILFRLSPEQRT